MSVADISERNAEMPAYVRFERRAVESKTKTLEAGRSVSVDVDYALITPPYSKDVHEQKVDSWLSGVRRDVGNKRIPESHYKHWEKSYQAFKNGQEMPLEGTPIKDWSAISPAQIKNLIAINILTVEMLAGCNDEGLRRIGSGAVNMRKLAINWLKAATDHGPLTQQVTHLEAENAQLKASNEGLVEKNKALMSQLESSNQPVFAREEEAPKPRGVQLSDIMPEDIAPEIKESDIGQELSLADQYIQKFGKKPHHKMKPETIQKHLEA